MILMKIWNKEMLLKSKLSRPKIFTRKRKTFSSRSSSQRRKTESPY